jgi:hypothetical protein
MLRRGRPSSQSRKMVIAAEQARAEPNTMTIARAAPRPPPASGVEAPVAAVGVAVEAVEPAAVGAVEGLAEPIVSGVEKVLSGVL